MMRTGPAAGKRGMRSLLTGTESGTACPGRHPTEDRRDITNPAEIIELIYVVIL